MANTYLQVKKLDYWKKGVIIEDLKFQPTVETAGQPVKHAGFGSQSSDSDSVDME